ncbi:MAG: choice-of-anchor V domain-containing protein [Blastocatellia bacterium]|nr:choice-of-anchor V domain-containing protein [Blastocatellia bacterium]
MKVFILAIFCGMVAMVGLNGTPAGAFTGGPIAGRTGAPSEATCTACHGGAGVNTGGGSVAITGLPATYTPNQEINVTVTVTQASRVKFGFQLTALDDQGRRAGDLVVTDSNRTQVITGVVGGNLRQYMNHTGEGTTANPAGQLSWTFRWKAPATSAGRVTFYAAGNATNNNSGSGGDLIYTTSAAVNAGAALSVFTSVSAASFSQTATTAAGAILAGFGTGLSANVAVGSTTPLPTQLDGTEVEVRDVTNTTRKAQLFFVAPTQINYVVPDGTANGAATVTIKRSGTAVAEGTITVDTVGPGLFTANANGQGVPAAVALRVRGAAQTFESISSVTNGVASPIQIDLGPAGDEVYLILFGTAIRNAQQAQASCTIGGTASPLLGFAAAPGFVGLDQINVGPIPRSLIGRDLVDVILTVAGKQANTVQVRIK